MHHIEIAKTSLDSQSTWAWLNECLARLFIHSRLYQCSRFYGKRIYLEDICPGGCELRKRRKRDKLKLKKKFRTITKKASMIRAMSIRESSSENVANAVTPQVLETTTKMWYDYKSYLWFCFVYLVIKIQIKIFQFMPSVISISGWSIELRNSIVNVFTNQNIIIHLTFWFLIK